MKILKFLRAGVVSGRFVPSAIAALFAFAFVAAPEVAMAQDPFSTATSAANSVVNSLKTFALAVGAIGMVSCLLLGFFGKLNWKWVATGIGVSFAIAIVVPAISWLNSLGG